MEKREKREKYRGIDRLILEGGERERERAGKGDRSIEGGIDK